MSESRLNIDDILDVLDALPEYSADHFPVFDSLINFWFIGARLTVFSDKSRWAIVIGETSYCRSAITTPLFNVVSSHGNCIQDSLKKGILTSDSAQFLPLLDDREEELFIGSDLCYFIRPEVDKVSIRGRKVPLQFAPEAELESGLSVPPTELELAAFPVLASGARWAHKVFRAVYSQDPSILLPTDEQMRNRIPHDIPKVIDLSEWHHPNFGQYASETDCFRQLAKVCVTGSRFDYEPTEPPNTHWSHWESVLDEKNLCDAEVAKKKRHQTSEKKRALRQVWQELGEQASIHDVISTIKNRYGFTVKKDMVEWIKTRVYMPSSVRNKIKDLFKHGPPDQMTQ